MNAQEARTYMIEAIKSNAMRQITSDAGSGRCMSEVRIQGQTKEIVTMIADWLVSEGYNVQSRSDYPDIFYVRW